MWPARGFDDTELGALMEPEVGRGETEVYPRVRMIALHKSQQPVATTSSFFIRLFREARWLLFMTDIFLLITAVVVAKSYVAPLSEDIDLK